MMDHNYNWTNSGGTENNTNSVSYTPQTEAVYQATPDQPQPPKKKGGALKMMSVALVGALIGGTVSGVSVSLLSEPSDSQVQQSLDEAMQVIEQMQDLPSGQSMNAVLSSDGQYFSVKEVVKKVNESVVGIRATYSQVYSNIFGMPDAQQASSEGSGIIYKEDGYIITNFHVIEDAVENGAVKSDVRIEVYLNSQMEEPYLAQVVGYDSSADLAVIKIEATGLSPIEIGDSDALEQGEWAIAIGNPGGLNFMNSASFGIISGLDRKIQIESVGMTNLIQTDAAINPGNSGGALVNAAGQLIGVNSAKLADEDFEGMGFAIPVNEVVEICDRIIENEGAPAPYLGISASTRYTSNILQSMGYPAGVLVVGVDAGSPAEAAGIQVEDIIVAFNGNQVTSFESLVSEKNKCKPNDTATLMIFRQGKYQELSIVLGDPA